MNKIWNKKYKQCKVCGTIKKKHKAKGLCDNCYAREWNNSNKSKSKEDINYVQETIDDFLNMPLIL